MAEAMMASFHGSLAESDTVYVAREAGVRQPGACVPLFFSLSLFSSYRENLLSRGRLADRTSLLRLLSLQSGCTVRPRPFYRVRDDACPGPPRLPVLPPSSHSLVPVSDPRTGQSVRARLARAVAQRGRVGRDARSRD